MSRVLGTEDPLEQGEVFVNHPLGAESADGLAPADAAVEVADLRGRCHGRGDVGDEEPGRSVAEHFGH